jgi:hypothetical protein
LSAIFRVSHPGKYVLLDQHPTGITAPGEPVHNAREINATLAQLTEYSIIKSFYVIPILCSCARGDPRVTVLKMDIRNSFAIVLQGWNNLAVRIGTVGARSEHEMTRIKHQVNQSRVSIIQEAVDLCGGLDVPGAVMMK